MATYYFYHLLQELTLKFYMLASPAWPTHCLSRPGIKFCLPLACWMTLGNLPTFSVLQFSLWKQRDASPHFDNLMGKLTEMTLEKCEGHIYLYQILPATVLGKFFSLDFHDNRHPRFSSHFSGYSFAVTLQAPPPLQVLRSWCALEFSLRHPSVPWWGVTCWLNPLQDLRSQQLHEGQTSLPWIPIFTGHLHSDGYFFGDF